MRRLAIFCDGTWNRLSSPEPTNVVIAAQCVLPRAGEIEQLTYYNEGVGTSHTLSEGLETRLAGAFGLGLFDKIADAYRFLVFNYVPGDEIYIFGFSRGAFTARSLAGLIRKCGILRKDQLHRVAAAFNLYKDGLVKPDQVEAVQFRATYTHHAAVMDAARLRQKVAGSPEALGAPAYSIKYVGVWDTVGALGVPKYLRLSDLLGTAQRYGFHDPSLSSIVEGARHAVAIDEDRKAFEPTLWDNLDTLNALPTRQGNYQQVWFPGDHGSVGGGGDIRGLSDAALLWIIEGAERAGLAFDETALQPFRDSRDFRAPLVNVREPMAWPRRLLDRLMYPRTPRHGPALRTALADSANSRLDFEAKGSDWQPYRPAALPEIVATLK